MSINKCLVLIVCLFFIEVISKPVEIYATGEIHGLISSCDCPEMPGGGIAGISSIVEKTQNSRLLLDAGGFSGGGIYDLYTGGYIVDSVKTGVMIEAMSVAGYDAVAVGDEELLYHPKWLNNTADQFGLTLLSANVQKNDSTYWFERYKIVKKGDVKFLITALTTKENVLKKSKEIRIIDPLDALNDILENVEDDWDVLVILSHLGEEVSRIIYNKENSFHTVVINGHRKISSDAGELKGNNVLLQFGFQGKDMSYLSFLKNTEIIKKPFWIKNDENIIQNKEIVNLSKGFKIFEENNKHDVYDLYLMSQCPFGLPVLNEITKYLGKKIVKNELNIWFIGDIDTINGTLHSLHGENEVNDELLWLSIKALYPEYWNVFISMVSSSEFSTRESIGELKLDLEKLNAWIEDYGKLELKNHYERSNRLAINASPTLFLNNQPFEGEMTSEYIRAKDCYKYNLKNLNCDSLPECFIDSDCKKKGFYGNCFREKNRWGKCQYEEATKFDFTIISSKDMLFKVDNDMIATTKEMFHGANINYIEYTNSEAKQILREYNVSSLPFAFFSKDVSKDKNFKIIEEGLFIKDDMFFFKDNYVTGTYLFKRERSEHKIEMFIRLDHLNEQFENTIGRFIKSVTKDERIFIYPIFDREDTTKIKIQALYAYQKNNVKLLSKENVNINNNNVLYPKVLEFYNNYMLKYKNINGEHPFLFLINNREVVIPHNNKETSVILKKIISYVK